MHRFRLPGAEFDAMARGRATAHGLALLRAGQVSRQLLLLRALVRRQHPDQVAHALLTLDLAAVNPAAVRGVLTDPWVCAWTLRCLRQGTDDADDAARLTALAAAAAVRAGVDTDLTVPAAGGRLHLPTLGSWRVPDGHDRVELRIRSGTLAATAGPAGLLLGPGGRGRAGWSGSRELVASCDAQRLSVVLSDSEPDRDCYEMAVADRLTTDEVAHWQALLTRAWTILVRHVPQRAEEMAAGLRALVPLATWTGQPGLSATARGVFGAMALTTPSDGTAMAVTLVHERQHAVLNALIDLVALHRASDGTTYQAPWRPDPRPIGGLLHGVYAFMAVADLWRRLREAPGLRERSQAQFASIMAQLAVAGAELARSHELTPAGERFRQGVRDELDAMAGAAVR